MANPQFAFTPTGASTSVSTSAGASTAATALPGGDCDCVYLINTGAAVVNVALGNSTVQATSSNFPVAAGGAVCLSSWGLQFTHFAVYSATGSITVFAQRGRGGYTFQSGLSISGSSSGGWSPTPYLFDTPGTYQIVLTGNTVRQIFLTGTGPGGGGAGGWNASGGAGGGGGGAGVGVENMPILVDPTLGSGIITINIPAGGLGGASGANGSEASTDTYIQGACIISPYADATGKIILGPGLGGKTAPASGTPGDGGGTAWSLATKATPVDTLNTGAAHAAKALLQANGNMNYQWMHLLFQAPGAGVASGNCGSLINTLNGMGVGVRSASSPQGDAAGGPGSPGGGGSHCVGGAQGAVGLQRYGQQGMGAGAGGGGGMALAAGANGNPGKVLLLV